MLGDGGAAPVAYYANPYSRAPFWRAREDDGRSSIHVLAPQSPHAPRSDHAIALRPPKHLDRYLFAFRRGGQTAAVVYMAPDDGAARWQLFLLVAAVLLVTLVKRLVEGVAQPMRCSGEDHAE